MDNKNETPLQDKDLASVFGGAGESNGRTPEPGDEQRDWPCPKCGSRPIWVHNCGGMGPGGAFTERWCDACGYTWNE